MAAAAVVTARPSQALRQRRESQRPSQSKPARIGSVETSENMQKETPPKPYVRDSKYILKKFHGLPPSLIIHLHATYFRLEHQEDTFQYDSPMKLLIQHLRDQTLPHDMLEELYEAGVPFYDGCLIVEVYDHKSTSTTEQSRQTSNTDDGNKVFSVHNYNPFTTPSPYVPYHEAKHGMDEANGANVKKEGDVDPSEDNDAPGEKDDTAEQGTNAPQVKAQPPAKVYTIVLHPTGLSKEADMRLLANTPMPDAQSIRRQQSVSGKTAATPTMPHPPTPLTSVPSTPLLSTKSPKRQKMVIDGSNHYEFEAAMLLQTTPRLYLEPTNSFEESMHLIDTLSHPNNKHPPPAPRKRKRTTAELAADEADAAAQQRFVLIGDDRKSSAVTTENDEGQVGIRSTNSFEPRFSRFKTLETIKMQHEEKERRKKEEEARQAHQRKQLQAQQKAEQERREEEQARQNEQERLLAQRREQARRLNMAQAAQAAQAAQINNTGQFAQVTANNTQAPLASPVVRQQTPMAAPSPSVVSVAAASHPMSGVPMAATSSSQGGAGSPPRPPSVVSHHGVPQISMVRQVSQQHPQQVPSRNSTPQLMQGTPQLNNSVPVNRIMTPQPMVSQGSQQGSPIPAAIRANAAMAAHQQLGPEQLAALQRQRLQHMQRQHAVQMGNMGSSPHQMTPEQQQLLMMRAQSQAGQQNMQNTAQYQQQLARQQQMASQMSNANAQDMNGSPQHGQMRAAVNLSTLQGMFKQYQEAKVRYTQQFPAGLPPNVQAQLQSMENRIRMVQQQLQRPGAQPNMAAVSAGAPQIPAGMTQQQYVAIMQQRHQQAQQQLRQQQLMMRQMQGQNSQMNMGNMGMNMAGMQGMQNMQNMQGMQGMQGMQNMMAMQGNPGMANMQGMMWMNQGQGRGQGMG